MALFPRRRRTRVGGEAWRDADHALMPIPASGGLVSCQLRNAEGRPLPGAAMRLVEADGLRAPVTESTTDAFGFFTAAVPAGSYLLRATLGGYRTLAEPVDVTRGGHASLGVVVLPTDQGSTRPPRGRWVIDPAHSQLGFVARHIALSRVYGRFTSFAGAVEIVEPFEDSTLDVVIDAASIETHNEARDAHLRSADFLDTENHPQLTYTSTRMAVRAGNTWDVDGDLTIRDRTNDVRLAVTYLGTQSWNGTRAGVVATAALHREHFTLNWQQMVARGVPVVGSTIELHLDVQAVLEI
jgi:polyisoprenoid-binding protein YceI